MCQRFSIWLKTNNSEMLLIGIYLGESKVLLYFRNVRYNSAALTAFIKVMKEMNYTGQWDADLVWYSPSATFRICLNGLKLHFRIHGFRATWLCLIIEVLATRRKFLETFGYCIKINCAFTFRTTNVLVAFPTTWPSSKSGTIRSRIRQRYT